MKVILLAVMSLDGKLTKWKDSPASDWASAEDFAHFSKIVHENTLLVMGSNTFLVNRPKSEKERLRIVMTRTPEKYRQFAAPGQLEFTSESPKQMLQRVEKKYQQMLLVGGQHLITLFLQENLIDEILVTIEPRIFGKGAVLVDQVAMNISLKLLSIKQLNNRGTLLVKYKVV